jgi:hypothetical protein
MAERHGHQTAADAHALHEAREDVGRILDPVALHIGVERLEQPRDARHGLGVEQEAHIDRGLAERGLAEQPLLQRAGVEGGPLDGDAVPLGPGLGDVAALRARGDGLHDAVGEDVERAALRPRGTRPERHEARADEGCAAAEQRPACDPRHGLLPVLPWPSFPRVPRPGLGNAERIA